MKKPMKQIFNARTVMAVLAMLIVASCTAPSVRLATKSGVQHAPAPSPSQSVAAAATGATTAAPPSNPSNAALAQFQAILDGIAASMAPSIVQIQTDSGLGSGIVFDSGGDIVTNAHVVTGATSLMVLTSDGRSLAASPVGIYTQNDLAVIKVTKPAGLVAAKFADSSTAKVGDIVLAVGSPYGLNDTVTEGIVSAVGRVQSEGNGVTLTDLVQTSAPINPGNSGGALVNIAGEVIGIPTLSAADSQNPGQSSTGIGFAISSNQVVSVAKQLIATGSVTHTGRAYMGVSVRNSSGTGALIASVSSGGPADNAGIAAGARITSISGHDVVDANSLTQVLSTFQPGQKVPVTLVMPDGSSRTVTVTLGERPPGS